MTNIQEFIKVKEEIPEEIKSIELITTLSSNHSQLEDNLTKG